MNMLDSKRVFVFIVFLAFSLSIGIKVSKIQKSLVANHTDAEERIICIPEYAPQKAVWIQWPYRFDSLDTSVIRELCTESGIPTFMKIVRECRTEGEVHILVPDNKVRQTAEETLVDNGVPLNNVFFEIIPYDHPWSRDNGPFFIQKNGELHILDFGFRAWNKPEWGPWLKDDAVPNEIAKKLGIGYTKVTYVDPDDGEIKPLVNEGGAFLVSDEGTLIQSWRTIETGNPGLSQEEAERILKEAFGAHTVFWTHSGSGYGASGHVDGFMKIYDHMKVAISNRRIHDNLAAEMEEAGWEVLRPSGRFNWVSYNHLPFNGKVLIGYSSSPPNPEEREILQQMYPGRTLVPIDAGVFIFSGGGIHCITQQQPWLPSDLPEVTIHSYTHPTEEPSYNDIAEFHWTCKGIPVTDYAYIFDQNPDTLPEPIGYGPEITACTQGLYYGIPDGEWYLHVRARSYYGWNDFATHYKITVQSSLDSDLDKIPDYWEDINDLDKNDPADEKRDNDGDGLTNFYEWFRRTDPNNPDTDGGGVSDGDEFYRDGTDLLDAADDASH